MENFKSVLFSIVIFTVFILAVFWAFKTLESGSVHINNQINKELKNKNKELEKEVADLQNQVDSLNAQKEADMITAEDTTTSATDKPVEQQKVTTSSTIVTKNPVLKYQSLINELQKIYNDKVIMEKGSQGIRVGSIQKFLNLYNNTSIKVDNDFGPSMVTAVAKFQKDIGLKSDGGVGPSTVSKMIDWLKKQ